MDEDTKTAVVSYVKRRLAPQPVKIRADIEVTCFTYEGTPSLICRVSALFYYSYIIDICIIIEYSNIDLLIRLLTAGIDAIKEALLEGESKSVSEAPVKIKLIAPPMYVMTTMTLDKDIGVETLNTAIEAIAVLIRSKG